MATLSANPEGLELEDFVAAHFVSRGAYVETGVTARDPKDILELDIVWTNYRVPEPTRNPVEVKSGQWQLGDLFKCFGWTRYLGLPAGQFVCRHLPTRVSLESIRRICGQMSMQLVHIEDLQKVDDHFQGIGLPAPDYPALPQLWRFSFWAQRQLLKILSLSIEKETCPATARVAKDYAKLINDAIFFEGDVRSRVALLLDAHFNHRWLGRTAANELAGRGVNFDEPPESAEFRDALYAGKHFPVQACLYLAHRARLAILKAAVDYTIAKDRGELPQKFIQIFETKIDISDSEVYTGFLRAIESLSGASSFRLFPTLWQVFLWSWGGFILEDRKEEEYRALSSQTGVPIDEIDIALGAFDKLFVSPTSTSWFVKPDNDSRRILKLMPAAIRGIGAFGRLSRYGKERYTDFGYADDTGRRLALDHDCGARLLNAAPDVLAR